MGIMKKLGQAVTSPGSAMKSAAKPVGGFGKAIGKATAPGQLKKAGGAFGEAAKTVAPRRTLMGKKRGW